MPLELPKCSRKSAVCFGRKMQKVSSTMPAPRKVRQLMYKSVMKEDVVQSKVVNEIVPRAVAPCPSYPIALRERERERDIYGHGSKPMVPYLGG